MRIKICGITNETDAHLAIAAGADYLGLIRADSRRQIDAAGAAEIVRHIADRVPAVLVFRNAPFDEIDADLGTTRAAGVQLHGAEPASLVIRLRRTHPTIMLIRAWEVHGPESGAALAEQLVELASDDALPDVVLLDAPKGGAHPGYDTLAAVADQIRSRGPVVWCAGGLTAENVEAAIAGHRYDGVDVASGVETTPGQKDADAVRRFIATVRNAASGM